MLVYGMIFRPLLFLLLMGIPLGVLFLLLRTHSALPTRLAMVLGFVGGGVGLFFSYSSLSPTGTVVAPS